ncbi:sigma-70 family RNA polymerase sigma factor [bacterium]|nr:sigma-70 family RNA polymerase sigma factor [bacterium]
MSGRDAAAVTDDQVINWIEAAQRGDRDSMERLIAHFQDRVWRRILYRIGDADEAWDVAQEVFVLCFRKIGQYRGEAKFWTWLARIADNQTLNRMDYLRRRGRSITFSLSELAKDEDQNDREWEPPDSGPSPRQQAAASQTMEALNKALNQVGEDHRQILLMRFADQLSYEEIAEALDISMGTVKSRINRARTELRKLMEPYL